MRPMALLLVAGLLAVLLSAGVALLVEVATLVAAVSAWLLVFVWLQSGTAKV